MAVRHVSKVILRMEEEEVRHASKVVYRPFSVAPAVRCFDNKQENIKKYSGKRGAAALRRRYDKKRKRLTEILDALIDPRLMLRVV
jgi:hypothetical protein